MAASLTQLRKTVQNDQLRFLVPALGAVLLAALISANKSFLIPLAFFSFISIGIVLVIANIVRQGLAQE